MGDHYLGVVLYIAANGWLTDELDRMREEIIVT